MFFFLLSFNSYLKYTFKMKKLIIAILWIAFAFGCSKPQQNQKQDSKPNLLIIQTDEHNFRTLGCYRDLMSADQAYVWGKGIEVETPNLDRLAKEGAICTKYYASSPVCSPSRASFQTGLYPIAAKVPINGMRMDPNLTTFAEVLRQAGYQTDYVGKWHLAGTPSIGRIYMQPGYAFGYMDRTWQFESGHAKWFDEGSEPLELKQTAKVPKENQDHLYTSDFLADRCLELLERDKNKPFCMVVSFPNPHSPDISRDPYKSKYSNFNVKAPATMDDALAAKRPLWAIGGKNESGSFDEKSVREYFGMVKCIDDNVGRILKFLDDNKLSENTIVVFTSDHGDMLFEHHRINKDLPYEASARIPFLIRYPGKIKAGKVIHKSYTTADFPSTILGLLKQKQIEGVHGINDAELFLNNEMETRSDRIIYMTDSPFNEWTAATDGRYKLVLSCKEKPWLFDLKEDPSELVNLYSKPEYEAIAKRLQTELLRQMKLYKEPALDLGFDYCYSTDDAITYVGPYAGKTHSEIKAIEKDVLEDRILQIHKQCFRKRN